MVTQTQIGELLREMPKQKPGEYQRLQDETVAPTLSDLGIRKIESHRWQRIATRRLQMRNTFRIYRLMAIARHPTISNDAHGHHLPPSWRTLYEHPIALHCPESPMLP